MPEPNEKKIQEGEEKVVVEPDGSQDSGDTTPPDPPKEPEFSRADFKGKDPAEIEAYVNLLEGTVKEQGTKMTVDAKEKAELEAQLAAPLVKTMTEEELESEMLLNPARAMKRYTEESEERILGSMAHMIEPFKQNLASQAEEEAVASLRGNPRFSRLDELLPRMRLYAQQAGSSLAAPGNAESFYYLAEGRAVTEQGGSTVHTSPISDPTRTPVPATTDLPQGRPQNAPLPNADATPKVRELTENERLLARRAGQTPEQYLAWLSVEADEVVSYTGDKEND